MVKAISKTVKSEGKKEIAVKSDTLMNLKKCSMPENIFPRKAEEFLIMFSTKMNTTLYYIHPIRTSIQEEEKKN